MITLCQFMQDMKNHVDQTNHALANRIWEEYYKANGIYFQNEIEKSMAKKMFWIGYSIKQKMNEHTVNISNEMVRDKTILYKDRNGFCK